MSRKMHAEPPEVSDHVDEIIGQWNRECPEVDVSGMAIIGRVTRLEKVIRPLLNSVFADHDLESWEFDVLATLVRNGDPHCLTPGQLLESMMITSGAMTNRLDHLERRGFVTRAKCPTDRRQVLVALTTEGRAKLDVALIDHAANELAIVSALTTEQREQLIELLRLLHHAVTTVAPSD